MNSYGKKTLIETDNLTLGCFSCGGKYEKPADIKTFEDKVVCEGHLHFLEKIYGKSGTKSIKDYE